jgi:hypothetical protein
LAFKGVLGGRARVASDEQTEPDVNDPTKLPSEVEEFEPCWLSLSLALSFSSSTSTTGLLE